MRVVVGISGGVDSSVAAYLLKAEGHDVVGLFMRNWHDTTGTLSGDCPWQDDRMFARLTAQRLGIEFHEVDLSVEYRARVVDYMFAEYERGRTPNPDVLCNREIKFDAFLEKALELGAEKVATGHYCRVEQEGDKYKLLAGVDRNKDQSYFLCQLNQAQLSRAMFPIGHLEKSEVRAIAAREGLATAERKDSQGICFVGKVDLPVFLQQKLKAKRGDIVEILPTADIYATPRLSIFEPYRYTASMGRVVGEHNGAHFYTIGQRKGLGVGGRVEPLFVIAIDVDNNIVYVGQGDDHAGLYRRGLFIARDELHFLDGSMPAVGFCERFDLRIRYRQPLQGGVLEVKPEGGYVTFDEPQRGVTAGQFAAWYRGDDLIGSGVIF